MARGRTKSAGELVRIADSNAVQEGELFRAWIGKQRILLTRWEGEVIAIDAFCPHAAADLGEGAVSRWKLICPDHGYCFDIRNGNILWPEDEYYRLKRYESLEENGSVYVRAD
ncbi:MAG: Rieske 2Fe-2S domain-containing protein [Chloroflexota bacterium]